MIRLRPGLALLACAAVALLAGAADVSAQCAMCRSTLEGSAEGVAMGTSFNRAILVLLAAPYLLSATFAAVVFRRRLERALGARWAALRTAGRRERPGDRARRAEPIRGL